MSQILQKCINGRLKELPSIYVLSVRYATKPRWVPMAKTKLFRVRERKPLPFDESTEIRRLFNSYRTQYKAVMDAISSSYQASATAEEVILKREKFIQDAWDECMRINDEWNAQVALEREERDKQQMEERLEKAQLLKEKMDAKQAAKQASVDQMIREQQELSKTFITEKNIDAHIEKILKEEPYSFLWAIDQKGRVYEGYNKLPTPNKTLSVHRVIAENAIPEPAEPEVNAESQK